MESSPTVAGSFHSASPKRLLWLIVAFVGFYEIVSASSLLSQIDLDETGAAGWLPNYWQSNRGNLIGLVWSQPVFWQPGSIIGAPVRQTFSLKDADR